MGFMIFPFVLTVLYLTHVGSEQVDDVIIDLQELLLNCSVSHAKQVEASEKQISTSGLQLEECRAQGEKIQQLTSECGKQAGSLQQLSRDCSLQAEYLQRSAQKCQDQSELLQQMRKQKDKEYAELVQQLTRQSEREHEKVLQQVKKQIEEQSRNSDCTILSGQARDCVDWLATGNKDSGLYRICPVGWRDQKGFSVFCDMETDGGGWMVFQRRGDFGEPRNFFFKSWDEYKQGFGHLKKMFWLGNDRISFLSRQVASELRVDLQDEHRNKAYAKYDSFRLEDEGQQFKIQISGYSGTAGNSLSFHNGQRFSTKDRDHDQASVNCANEEMSAWWFKACGSSSLNGVYVNPGPTPGRWDGLYWQQWKGSYYSLAHSEMKMRRRPLP